MSKLAEIIAKDLEADKTYLKIMNRLLKKVKTSVDLDEEPGEILITLLMKPEEIEESVREAVNQVLGNEYVVSNIYTACEKRIIHFEISSCKNS